MMGGDARPERRAATRVPWLGLLLWGFACAALLVSLITRADDLDHERRVLTRSETKAQSSDLSYPVRRLTRQASELSVSTGRRPLSR